MSVTPNLNLPLLASGQAQKELDVNLAHVILDAILGGVIDRSQTAPPASPADGDAYIVAATATGAWAGYEDYIAYYFESAWYFVPAESAGGAILYVQDEDVFVRWDHGSPGGYETLSITRDENTQALGSIGGAQNIDISAGQHITLTMSSDLTVTFTNPPDSGKARGFTIEVTETGGSPANTVTWPGSVEWPLGVAPTQTEAATDVYTFYAVGSSRYIGAKAIEAIA